MSANSPVGSTLAILERTLKVMSAVNARIYYAMKKEFGLLKNLIRDYTDPNYVYDPSTGTPGAKQDDYNKVQLIPVADPNAATMAQKVVQYQAVMQMAQQNPTIYDLPELNKQMLEVLGVKNINKLIPDEDDVKQLDPVSENMNILNSKPVKAFLDQDHEAHIEVHMAFANDPKIRMLVGQSTKASLIQAAMEAHIAEHVAFQYRIEIEKQLGVPLPPVDDPLPVDVENDIARLTAGAAEKLLQQNSAEVQQKQAQQQQQDPIVQMQQQELAIKQQEAQTKAQKMAADVELEKAKLELDKMKIDSQERIAGAKIGSEVSQQQAERNAKELMEGTKMGIQASQKNQDFALRAKESRMRDETVAHEQKLKDKTEIDVTKDEDNTN
jgi:hypothetical protein